MATIVTKRQIGDLIKSVIPRAVLLAAPVTETLQRQLAEHFLLPCLYEQDDPITFLREQGENVVVVVTCGDISVANNVLELLPQAGLITVSDVGTDVVDLAYARSWQITVTITSGVLTSDVVDLVVGLLLAGLHQLRQDDRFVCKERWLSGGMPLATQASGKRIGLPGMGNTGQAIARRTRGFDMQVLYTDHRKIAGLDYQQCADLHTLAHESDFLMTVASGGEANRGIIDASVFNVMPAYVQLINITCGSLVGERVLIHVLQNDAIAEAGPNVFEQEPQTLAVLIVLGNIVLQPYVASATQETRQKVGEAAFTNVAAWFVGAALPDTID